MDKWKSLAIISIWIGVGLCGLGLGIAGTEAAMSALKVVAGSGVVATLFVMI